MEKLFGLNIFERNKIGIEHYHYCYYHLILSYDWTKTSLFNPLLYHYYIIFIIIISLSYHYNIYFYYYFYYIIIISYYTIIIS